MAKMSKSQFEDHLNELYTDCYSMSEAIDNFCYLNDGKIKESTIVNAYHNHMLGTLLRRYDSIAFHVAYNEQ